MYCKRNHLAIAIGLLLSAGLSQAAYAQTAAPISPTDDSTAQDATTIDTVTVTGSRG